MSSSTTPADPAGLFSLFRSQPLSGQTRVAAVIGDPVGHSLSPTLHNAAFATCGLDWIYVAFPVRSGDGAAAVQAMRALGIDGLSVTMPHKHDVLGEVDDMTDDVRALDAANTLVRVGRKVRAHNTDGQGFVDGLRADGVEPDGKVCVLVGAGGAGRAVARALGLAGAREVVVLNRDETRAHMAVGLAGPAGRLGVDRNEISGADIVVNATPLGMGETSDTPFDPVLLGSGQVVCDLIYHPLVTPLMAAASERGAKTIGGLSMLLGQAALQFTLWTGEPAPIAAMRAAIAPYLS